MCAYVFAAGADAVAAVRRFRPAECVWRRAGLAKRGRTILQTEAPGLSGEPTKTGSAGAETTGKGPLLDVVSFNTFNFCQRWERIFEGENDFVILGYLLLEYTYKKKP